MTTHKEMTLEPCREAFEKWFLGQDANMPIDLRKREDGEYEFLHAESDWTAWQAAWNTRHPKPMVQAEATLRENKGVPNQRALNYVIHAEELIGNYTGNDRDVINAHGLIGNARAELEAKLTKTAENINLPAEVNAALKNPSDAGGE